MGETRKGNASNMILNGEALYFLCIHTYTNRNEFSYKLRWKSSNNIIIRKYRKSYVYLKSCRCQDDCGKNSLLAEQLKSKVSCSLRC